MKFFKKDSLNDLKKYINKNYIDLELFNLIYEEKMTFMYIAPNGTFIECGSDCKDMRVYTVDFFNEIYKLVNKLYPGKKCKEPEELISLLKELILHN